jgi:hypothetical protein
LSRPDGPAERHRAVARGFTADSGGRIRYASLSDPDGNTPTLQEMSWRTGAAF